LLSVDAFQPDQTLQPWRGLFPAENEQEVRARLEAVGIKIENKCKIKLTYNTLYYNMCKKYLVIGTKKLLGEGIEKGTNPQHKND